MSILLNKCPNSHIKVILVLYLLTGDIFVRLGDTCIPGWFQCEQSCYYLSPANYSMTVTWYEAKQRCLDLVSGQAPAGQDFTASRLNINEMVGGGINYL